MNQPFRPLLAGVALVSILAGCAYEAPEGSDADGHIEATEEWRARRLSSLQSEGGYLALVGLHWLEPGSNRIGSDPGSDIVVDGLPPRAGVIVVDRMPSEGDHGAARFIPVAGTDLTSKTDALDGPIDLIGDAEASELEREPTTLVSGTTSFFMIERDGRLGVRALDTEAATRVNFEGIEHYPVSPEWRIEGRFVPFDEVRMVRLEDYAGGQQTMESPGKIHFEHDGWKLTLDVYDSGDNYFIIFRDETSGEETYGAGRYLYTETIAAEDGSIVIDFNRAYNPPCAFTPFATCPLPPRQNWLPIRVEAGEKDYHLHDDEGISEPAADV